jgi:hypothetical protein
MKGIIMPKIVSKAPQIEGIHKALMKKITGQTPLAKNESVITAWKFGDNPAHAGQLMGKKTLPNGNIQTRVTTAYAGDSHMIATDTKVYSPSGELLKAYHGIRGAHVDLTDANGVLKKSLNETSAYSSKPNEIAKIIQQERKMNPDVKYY